MDDDSGSRMYRSYSEAEATLRKESDEFQEQFLRNEVEQERVRS